MRVDNKREGSRQGEKENGEFDDDCVGGLIFGEAVTQYVYQKLEREWEGKSIADRS